MKFQKWVRISLMFLAGWSAATMAKGGDLKLRELDPELGEALGFKAYKFEAELADDEFLVIECTRVFPDQTEMVSLHIARPSISSASYLVSVVDSGAFHPSLRGTMMVRLPNSSSHLENARLANMQAGVNLLEFNFAKPLSNVVDHVMRWEAFVVNQAEFEQRWPEVSTPQLPEILGHGYATNVVLTMNGKPVESTPSDSSEAKP